MKDQEIKFVPGIMTTVVLIVLFLITKFVIVPTIKEENIFITETSDNNSSDVTTGMSDEIMKQSKESINLEYVGKSKGIYEYVDMVTGKHYLVTEEGGICER